MAIVGGCLCGAIRYQVDGELSRAGSCHCSMCRNWTGGPMQAAQAGSVTFRGEQHIKRYASSEWAERGFCSECGTSLFYCLKEPQMYMLATGCFDDAEQFSLAGEIYIDEKPGGYEFAGEHPRLTGAEFLASIGGDSEA